MIEWGYGRDNGPDTWADLCPEFAEAAQFKWQSPIALRRGECSEPKSSLILEWMYTSQGFQPEKAPNSFFLYTLEPKSFVVFQQEKYYLDNIHIHTPSEHRLDEKSSDFELHFVHKSHSDEVLVVGILLNLSQKEYYIEDEIRRLEIIQHIKQKSALQFDPAKLLPENHGYYHYIGSLTTPPTSGPVQWFVLDDVQEINVDFLRAFKKLSPLKNNRPIQPLAGRKIYHYTGE